MECNEGQYHHALLKDASGLKQKVMRLIHPIRATKEHHTCCSLHMSPIRERDLKDQKMPPRVTGSKPKYPYFQATTTSNMTCFAEMCCFAWLCCQFERGQRENATYISMCMGHSQDSVCNGPPYCKSRRFSTQCATGTPSGPERLGDPLGFGGRNAQVAPAPGSMEKYAEGKWVCPHKDTLKIGWFPLVSRKQPRKGTLKNRKTLKTWFQENYRAPTTATSKS